MPVFVNKKEISDDQVHAEMINHPADSLDAARLEAARALVVRQLLLEDAAARELIPAKDIDSLSEEQTEAIIQQLLDQVITTPKADADTCARYYDQHKDRFRDKKTEEILPFDLVRPHIVQYLEDKAYHAAFHAYLDQLMATAEIVGLAA
ncbi:hypothetical protein MNBD_ALPHA02-2263 [hydrothermal vent metagenome]|uniref:Uncharacterized protein n=1 Tax=hydrothermal vent metagenome TaxID=652676 RepID=A0A3B0RDM9_9ZZZZ